MVYPYHTAREKRWEKLRREVMAAIIKRRQDVLDADKPDDNSQREEIRATTPRRLQPVRHAPSTVSRPLSAQLDRVANAAKFLSPEPQPPAEPRALGASPRAVQIYDVHKYYSSPRPRSARAANPTEAIATGKPLILDYGAVAWADSSGGDAGATLIPYEMPTVESESPWADDERFRREVGRPPTLAEMERDMKTWTHHKHEVEMLAIQRGRMLEYDRAKSTIEALEGIHADQSSANERLQETVASLRAQLARQACDAKKELKAYARSASETHAALQAECDDHEGRLRMMASSHGESEKRVHSLERELQAAHGELQAAHDELDEMHAQMAYHKETFRLPLHPDCRQAISAAASEVQTLMASGPELIAGDADAPWQRAANYLGCTPSMREAASDALIRPAREATRSEPWSESLGAHFLRLVVKEGGRHALAAMVLDSGFVAATVEGLIEGLTSGHPAMENVARIASASCDLSQLEGAIVRAEALSTPAELLAPYRALLNGQAHAEQQARRGAAMTIQAKAHSRRERELFARQRAATIRIQAVASGREQRRAFATGRTSAVAIQAAVLGRRQRRDYQLQRSSAIRVQATARGVRLRQQNKAACAELEAELETDRRRRQHAELEEDRRRREKAKLEEELDEERRRAQHESLAASRIQARASGRREQRAYLEKRMSVVHIQSAARGLAGRNEVLSLTSSIQSAQMRCVLRLQNMRVGRGFSTWRQWWERQVHHERDASLVTAVLRAAQTEVMRQRAFQKAVRGCAAALASKAFEAWAKAVAEARAEREPPASDDTHEAVEADVPAKDRLADVIFKMIDVDQSGFIDPPELQTFLLSRGESVLDVEALVARLDTNGDGKVDIVEWRHGWNNGIVGQ